MKRFELIFALCLVGLVFAYPAWAAEGTGAMAYNWSGFYVGAHGAYAWTNSSSNTSNSVTGQFVGNGNSNDNRGSGGIQIGNDFMVTPNILIGLDLRASYVGASSDENTTNAAGTVLNTHTGKTDWSESLAMRVGYVYNNWLFYGRGGVVFDQGNVKRTQVTGTTGQATPGTSETVDNNRVGWTVGGGVEYGFLPGLSAFAEYRYSAASYTEKFPIAQRSSDIDSHSNAIVVGVNYKFNWGAPLSGTN